MLIIHFCIAHISSTMFLKIVAVSYERSSTIFTIRLNVNSTVIDLENAFVKLDGYL
ncbi:hypothetical protein WH47_06595 [Habropoda laboriosa]|uniref:Uncharacterized protein n=1 Tax=Habropoda laboriosa TaxID=597456 RepID=A0A0L7QRN5_9HYME|nr:hypothetical protein WH47_06595 [Habropoda laboriosa]